MTNKGLILAVVLSILFGTTGTVWAGFGTGLNIDDPLLTFDNSMLIQGDTLPPIEDRDNNAIMDDSPTNPFDLDDPPIIETDVTYDPETGYYIITETIGDNYYRPPTYMTFEEYMEWSAQNEQNSYLQQLSNNLSLSGSATKDPIEKYKEEIRNKLIDRLFGSNEVDIRPQGNIDLTFGVDYQNVENPVLTERQRRQGGFDFDMAIQMNVIGKIGDKLNLGTNYNTQATFDFDNQMKLEYAGDEDEIIQKIEAGNVSLPLRSSLIQGSQSLFGIKTDLQFGRLSVSAIASQKKSRRENVQIQGGTQLQEFEIAADQYDENRHFFISHYNRDDYERTLENLPQINTLFKITKMEVWVTNTRNATEDVRDIVGFMDLGEPNIQKVGANVGSNPNLAPPSVPVHPVLGSTSVGLPANDANPLYEELLANEGTRDLDNSVSTLQSSAFGFNQGEDFEKVRARLLSPTEYTYHPELGYLSLNLTLQPDEVLGVSYEYTYNGEVFQVGEFTNDLPINADTLNVMFVKMLKSATPSVEFPMWDLMMKNVYSIGAYQVNPQDFKLDIFYQDPGGGFIRSLPEGPRAGRYLISLLNLDNLNSTGDPFSDGAFDFVPGVTINPQNGRVIFPVLEPFGSALDEIFTDPATGLVDGSVERYKYPQLYNNTVFFAREFPEFNRFYLRGSYKSSVSSEISLGAFNIPRGSVTVSAGGQQLKEGIDYDVDYNIGRVKILNDAILNSGLPVNVSYEDNTLFGFQTKTLYGTRLDYEVSENFNIGGTFMHVSERPFTQKVNIGDDPISNSIYGLDVQYNKDAPWLTKFVDKLPLLQTKENSSVAFTAEGAMLRPGHAKALNDVDQSEDRGGTVYIDDFEGAASNFDLRTPTTAWLLSSTPSEFQEAERINDLSYGYNRAKLNWYRIDPTLNQSANDPYTRQFIERDIFPNRQDNQTGLQNAGLFTFDLTYQPNIRGPYNFDVDGTAPDGTIVSAGTDPATGELYNPHERWGGIMRALQTNDFQAANIEFVEFWVLSPYINNPNPQLSPDGSVPSLKINLGTISEDVLKDSRRFFENGLPAPNSETPVDTTTWSRIPRVQAITNAFDNDPAIRAAQDLGLDGFDDTGEQGHYEEYLNALSNYVSNPNLYNEALADPANDNYLYHRDESYGEISDPNSTPTLERYNKFNNPQGNSQGENASATNVPDTEDINRDNTLNEKESYFEYEIKLAPDGTGGVSSSQFMVDNVQMMAPNGTDVWNWYQFKVPVEEFTGKEGTIQDFRSIRFMRMYLTDFVDPATLRFARLQLVRNQWRRYQRDLAGAGIGPIPDPSDPTLFDVTAVNIEENSGATPFPYVLPPGIERENAIGTIQNALQNEQSMALNVCNLDGGDARAVYKIINLDMRNYERLKMFVHAKSTDGEELEPGELSVFLRLGSDFENNYYEYEIPLLPSDTSQLGTDNNTVESQEAVWLEDNRFNFPLSLFLDAKKMRNADPTFSTVDKFIIPDPDDADNSVSVIGNPDLGYVKGVMIGLRNNTDADKLCAEVWVNELRLSGLNEEGGIAGLARLDVQMADFGNFTASASYTSIGFGGLEEKVQQRALEEVTQYDFATSLELGKFFPKNSGIRIPFYAQYSTTIETPKFDPYQFDLKLKDVLETAQTQADKDSLRDAANDYTSIRGFNFTNVRKERTKQDRKPMPWDVENLSLTYAYDRTIKHDPTIENDEVKRYRGSVDYNYASQLKPIAPFKNMKAKSKWLGLIRDFNFNPVPNSISVRNDINRHFGQITYRFADPQSDTYFDKRFTWDRAYGLQWNLSKGLTMGFNAINNAVIDEPFEYILDETTGEPVIGSNGLPQRITKEFRKDSIMSSIGDFGRNKHYNQTLNISYTLPTKQIPLLDWTQVKAQYNASYDWSRSSLNVDSLGNVVQNGHTRQISGDLDFTKLYNKSKYLKKINSKPKKNKGGKNSGGRDGRPDAPGGKVGIDKGKGGKDGPLKNTIGITDDKDEDEDKNDSKDKGKGKNKGKRPGGKNKGTDGAADGVLGKAGKVKKEREPTMAERILIRPLMTIRKARLSFSEQFSSVIPGYTAGTRLLGQSNDFTRPGWDYVFGFRQPYFNTFGGGSSNAWMDSAAENGWIVDNLYLNQQLLNNYTQTYDAKVTLEPFKDFRVDVNANRSFAKNHSEYFKVPEPGGEFEHLNAFDAGSLNMTFYTVRTFFRGNTTEDLARTFEDFEDNRTIISERLAELNTSGVILPQEAGDEDFAAGYGRYQQDVLIPAFLSAYTGKDAASYPLKIFNMLPRPNWRLTYNGLNKIEMFKDLFSSVSISHSYTSTLGMNRFATDLDFQQKLYNENTLNYYSTYEIPDLVINEQFAPLIGVDMRFKNDLTARFDWKKSRNLAMSFTDYQLSETNSEEYTLGIGYRVKGFKLPFKFTTGQGKDKKKTNELENDLNFKMDFSYRDDKTINHLLDQDQAVATRGSKIIRISPSIDYAVNKFVNVRIFFDRSRTIPATSASFPITNTQAGVTIRFSLTQ